VCCHGGMRASLLVLAILAACKFEAPADRCEDAADCADGEACVDHACVAGDCTSAAECEPGHACTDLACVAIPARGVDLLFVVDSSHTMQQEQAALGSAFIDHFVAVLEAEHGARPDLHIGVITTDMGIGEQEASIQNCSVNGDDGALRRPATACAPTDAYLIDADGGATVNYPGTLAEAFQCLITVGTEGCGFEQPLASLRRFLNRDDAAAFLRPEAALAVVILTDEDDCSADDTHLFDTTQMDITSELGPLTSYRCFEFGVRCDPDDPRAYGTKQGCVARTGSFLTDPAEVADLVRTTKQSPNVAVTVIAGTVTPVTVQTDTSSPNMSWPQLLSSCTSATGEAAPSIRLRDFAAEFGDHGSFASICSNLNTPLADLARRIAGMLE
jgi:hypothetical protein